jgi:hypothetical protein
MATNARPERIAARGFSLSNMMVLLVDALAGQFG